MPNLANITNNILSDSGTDISALVPTSRTLTINGTTFDLTANRSWTITSAGVVGTGTTNYIAKWSTSATIGDSLLFDNGTNVGIGTASPALKLHVNGDIRTKMVHYNANTENRGHRMYSRTMDVNASTTNTNIRFTVATGNAVQFQYEITFHATRLSGNLAETWYLKYTGSIAYDTVGNANERWFDLREQAGNGIAGVGRSNQFGYFDITNTAFDTNCRLTCVVAITCNNWDAVTVTNP
jgi:hypothetical protein